MDLKKLQPALESQLSLLGFELVLLEVGREGGDDVLTVYVEHHDHDKPVTHDDCVAVDNGLIAWLDVEFPSLRDTTTIHISSPGIERPLVLPSHYRRFLGRLCKLQTRVPQNGQKRFKGWIVFVSDSSVTIEEDGQLKEIPFNLIQKAKLAYFDEDKAPKPKHAAVAADEPIKSVGAEKSALKEA